MGVSRVALTVSVRVGVWERRGGGKAGGTEGRNKSVRCVTSTLSPRVGGKVKKVEGRR